MIDIFLKDEVNKLLKKKHVVFMGDSNIRALYKDCLCILKNNKLIPERILMTKMENSVYGDTLVSCGKRTNGRDYREVRKAKVKEVELSFYFLTKIYSDYVCSILDELSSKFFPDILILNSCLWDITRWGANGVEDFKKNLQKLMKLLKVRFPDCLVIWITTPPISTNLNGGFLIRELCFLKYSLRFHVMEANHFAQKVVIENGFDVLDSHYHLKMQIQRRCKDGIHWISPAVRYLTNLLLTHISLAFNVPLPGRYKPVTMEENFSHIINDQHGAELLQTPVKESEKINVPEKEPDSQNTDSKPSFTQPEKRRLCQSRSTPNISVQSFMNNKSLKRRRQRIRHWKQIAPAEPEMSSTPYGSPLLNHNQQYDSGFCQSPEPKATFDWHRLGPQYLSPSQIPLPSEPYPTYSPFGRYGTQSPMQRTNDGRFHNSPVTTLFPPNTRQNHSPYIPQQQVFTYFQATSINLINFNMVPNINFANGTIPPWNRQRFFHRY